MKIVNNIEEVEKKIFSNPIETVGYDCMVAVSHYKGLDKNKALKFIELASLSNNLSILDIAQRQGLAILLEDSSDTFKTLKELKPYNRAVVDYALCIYYGIKEERDTVKGKKLLEDEALRGNSLAYFELGVIAYLEKDDEERIKNFNKAYNSGIESAKYFLGDLNEH